MNPSESRPSAGKNVIGSRSGNLVDLGVFFCYLMMFLIETEMKMVAEKGQPRQGSELKSVPRSRYWSDCNKI